MSELGIVDRRRCQFTCGHIHTTCPKMCIISIQCVCKETELLGCSMYVLSQKEQTYKVSNARSEVVSVTGDS